MSREALSQDMGIGRLDKNRGVGWKEDGVRPGRIMAVMSPERAVSARTRPVRHYPHFFTDMLQRDNRDRSHHPNRQPGFRCNLCATALDAVRPGAAVFSELPTGRRALISFV
jgi:hypothetical protein